LFFVCLKIHNDSSVIYFVQWPCVKLVINNGTKKTPRPNHSTRFFSLLKTETWLQLELLLANYSTEKEGNFRYKFLVNVIRGTDSYTHHFLEYWESLSRHVAYRMGLNLYLI
jgi:hypothetical protein